MKLPRSVPAKAVTTPRAMMDEDGFPSEDGPLNEDQQHLQGRSRLPFFYGVASQQGHSEMNNTQEPPERDPELGHKENSPREPAPPPWAANADILAIQRRLFPDAWKNAYGPVVEALDKWLLPGETVLDVGCNRGTWVLKPYSSRIGRWIGIDSIEPETHILDEFYVGSAADIPLPDATVHVVLCYYVIEHLDNCQEVFNEFWRVLKDKGVVIFKTPNLLAPVVLLSKFTPSFFHRFFKSRFLGINESDVFPTYYRCNTLRALEQTAASAGFRRKVLSTADESYRYFEFNRILYSLSLLYSRALSLSVARPLRNQIVGVYEKSASVLKETSAGA